MADRSAYALLLVSVLLWGSTPIVEKLALGASDPLTGLFIRTALAAAAIAVTVAVKSGWSAVAAAGVRGLLLWGASGILASFVGMLTYFAALRRLPAGKVVPISACYPLVTAVLAVLVLGEELSARRILGTVLIVLGVWLVSEAQLPWEVGT